jgi:hypothetical protein
VEDLRFNDHVRRQTRHALGHRAGIGFNDCHAPGQRIVRILVVDDAGKGHVGESCGYLGP